MLTLLRWLMLCGVISLTPLRTLAGPYTFQVIPPPAPFVYAHQFPSLNDVGQVAFTGFHQPDPEDPAATLGVFLTDGTTTTTIHTGDISDIGDPDDTVLLTSLTPVNNAGQVVFFSFGTIAPGGLYVGDGVNPLVPISVQHDVVEHTASINNAGLVAFTGTGGGVHGLFVGSGGPLTTLLEAGVAQNGLTIETFLGPPALNDNEEIAFVARDTAGLVGLYHFAPGPGLTLITQHPALGLYPSINSQGDIVFTRGESGVFEAGVPASVRYYTAATQDIHVVVDTQTLFAVLHFARGVPVNDAGRTVFHAQQAQHVQGLFTGANPVAHKVVAEGETPVPGLQPGAALRLGRASLNNAGQIALIAHLGPSALDFEGLLLLATPKPQTLADSDLDGVPDTEDVCPNTVWPEFPTRTLGPYRYMLSSFDRRFDSRHPQAAPRPTRFTLEDTAGCSCLQIIAALDLGPSHQRHGCSAAVVQRWVTQQTP